MAQQERIHLLMQETWVQFLGQEDPLEKEMATHSSILAWRIPWTEVPRSLWSCKESDIVTKQHQQIFKEKYVYHQRDPE